MISRQWRGLAKPERADDYVAHLREDTFHKLQAIPGFIGASILRRRTDQGIEFLVVTQWTSLEAVGQFAGPDPSIAVVPENVQKMMIDYDRVVVHYEVVT